MATKTAPQSLNGRRPALLLGILCLFFAFCAELPDESTREDADKADLPWAMQPQLIIGHRGAPWSEIENTIPSFNAAIREGANAIEIDLCVTSDNQVVVWHDCDPNSPVALIRQSGGEGLPFIPSVPRAFTSWRRPAHELTLAEFRRHYGYAANESALENVFHSDPASAYIPTLAEVALWSQGNNARPLAAIFLDIKLADDDLDLVATMSRVIVEHFAEQPFAVFVMSPHEAVVSAMRSHFDRYAPSLSRRLILDFEKRGALEAARRIGTRVIATGKTPLRRWTSYLSDLAAIVENGWGIDAVIAWTIDDEKHLLSVIEAGVDGVMTNRPADLRRLLQSGWSEHDRAIDAIAECYASNAERNVDRVCKTSEQLGLTAALRKAQLVGRACERGSDDQTIDLFGCGFFNLIDVVFAAELGPQSGARIVWKAQEGEVQIVE